MNKFSLTCDCGDVMTVDAATREEAVEKLKSMMTPDMVAKHMAQKHAGQPVLSMSAVQAMIEQKTIPT